MTFKVPKADTSAEMEVRKILEGITEFKMIITSQQPIKTRYSPRTFIVDFMVGSNIVCEVHGDHRAKWFGKTRRAKDASKTNCLIAEGYNVIDIIGSASQIRKHAMAIHNWLKALMPYYHKYTLIDASTLKNSVAVNHDPPY
jgi:very-short-patch-repair endonuclease